MEDRSGLALLALLSGACGTVTNFSDASTAADASSTDGTTIPPPDAQERGTVTVDVRTLTNDDLPQAGATVVFVDPDGTPQRVTASSDGLASAEVKIGGSVTAVWLRENGARLVTILGVEPGDMLRVGTHGSPPGGPTGTTSVSITPQSGAATATVYTACGAYTVDNGQAAVDWNRGCEQSDDDILVMSFNGEGGATGYVYAGNQPNNPHPATVVMPSTWQFPGAFSAGYVNIPATIDAISATRHVRSGTGSLHSQYIAAEVAGRRTLALTLNGAPLVGDSLDLSTWFGAIDTQQQNLRAVRVRRRLPMTSAAELDVGASLLPFVGQATLDLTMRKVTWPQVGEGQPDAQVTSIWYFRTVGTSELSYEWRIIAPGGTGALTLPELPEAIRDLAPLPTDRTFNGDVALFALDTHDYKRLRSELDINYYEWLYDFAPLQSDTLVVSGMYSGK